MKTLQDTDHMPFGKYKDTRMVDVPAAYLLTLALDERSRPDVPQGQGRPGRRVHSAKH